MQESSEDGAGAGESNLEALINSICNGTVDQIGLERLEKLLSDTPEARRLYRRAMTLHHRLLDFAQSGY